MAPPVPGRPRADAPLRTFVVAGSNHPNHTVATRTVHAYLRWRNANARHPDILAAQRRERARIRSERQHRWGQPAHFLPGAGPIIRQTRWRRPRHSGPRSLGARRLVQLPVVVLGPAHVTASLHTSR
jgi:hypothetical protein